ncbi:MAG: thiamine phosphate synthase [Opitutales bacterium]|nr:thiamine phosphate synthase [Opitutales bacterium]
MSILSRVVGMVSRSAEADASARIAVMSPMKERNDDHGILFKLFENGLSVYHLRRPHWSASRCCSWIERVPVKWRSRIVVHQYPYLVRKYNLGGFHQSADGALPGVSGISGKISAQCEDFSDIQKIGNRCRRVMLGPVFPPEKYDVTVPRRTLGEYAAIAAYWRKQGGQAEVFAFGGVSSDNIRLCREAGFDGVVVVGAVWDTSDPVKAYKQLVRKW